MNELAESWTFEKNPTFNLIMLKKLECTLFDPITLQAVQNVRSDIGP